MARAAWAMSGGFAGGRGLMGRVAMAAAAMIGAMSPGAWAIAPAEGKDAGAPEPMPVVATIGMIADAARAVGGDRVAVRSLMGEGVDPHLYKASPGDLRMLSSARVVFYNGLHLEGRLADALVRLASRTRVVQVTLGIPEDQLLEPVAFGGHYDPHVWFDPSLWAKTLGPIADALGELDPAGKDTFAANASAYREVLSRLDGWARAQFETIPEGSRVLVTAHDAFGYLGRAYGLEVLGVQGISTDSEASLQDINALVDLVVARRVPAVFIESSVPRKTVDAIVEGAKSRGHTVTIGGELYSDAMGPDGSFEATYVGMIRHNVATIVRALGGTVTEPAWMAEMVAAHAGEAKPEATP